MKQSDKAIEFLKEFPNGLAGMHCLSKNGLIDMLTKYEGHLQDKRASAKKELEQSTKVFALIKYKKIIQGFRDVMRLRGFEITMSEFEYIFDSMVKGKTIEEIARRSNMLPLQSQLETLSVDTKLFVSDLLMSIVPNDKYIEKEMDGLAHLIGKHLLSSNLITFNVSEENQAIRIKGAVRVLKSPKIEFSNFKNSVKEILCLLK